MTSSQGDSTNQNAFSYTLWKQKHSEPSHHSFSLNHQTVQSRDQNFEKNNI